MATIIAYANDHKLMMIMTTVCLPLVFLLRKAKPADGHAAAAALD